VQAPQLCAVDALRRAERVDACAPQRLVDVDVPEAGERPLIEQGRLARRPPLREPLAEPRRGEAGVERFRAEACRQIRRELARFEHEPRAETADVAVGDIRSVV
jgi:hypothetical protein